MWYGISYLSHTFNYLHAACLSVLKSPLVFQTSLIIIPVYVKIIFSQFIRSDQATSWNSERYKLKSSSWASRIQLWECSFVITDSKIFQQHITWGQPSLESAKIFLHFVLQASPVYKILLLSVILGNCFGNVKIFSGQLISFLFLFFKDKRCCFLDTTFPC